MKVYTNFIPEDDIVESVSNKVTYGLWQNGVGTLTSFYTSSAQDPTDSDNSGKYYLDVYDTNPQIDPDAAVQFSVAYGSISGSGAPVGDYEKPTQAIYNSYRNTLLSPNQLFTINNIPLMDAYFISIKRSLLKQKLDPGNWELKIGSNTYIDNSGDSLNTTEANASSYAIVSGSIANGAYNSNQIGIVYPNTGILVFSSSVATPANTGGYDANHLTFLNAIKTGAKFSARSLEEISSTYYFVRVKNREYNYSSNPSFYTGSLNSVRYDEFVNDPKTFITTVGLYNDDNELVAVAKLSQPVKKSFSNEVTIQARLDF